MGLRSWRVMCGWRRRDATLPTGAALLLAVLLSAVRPGGAQEKAWDTKFMVGNDRYLQIHCAWNARERAGGPYASAPWPRGALATERALLFAARQVLRDEWKIGQVIAAEHPGGGHAQLAEAETNFYKEHTDHPPHLHINFIWPNWSGHVNTHFLTTEDGKVNKPWIIWWVPGYEEGERNPPAGKWWPELDQQGRPVWWQTWTEDGAIQLKRTAKAPVYTLRARNIVGDLGGADVYRDGQPIYAVQITQYDPLGLRLVVRVADLRVHKLITETFQGDPATHQTLTKHTVEETKPEELTPAAPPAKRE